MATRVSPPATNQDYGGNVAPPPQVSAGAGGTIIVQDEGVPLATAADTLNFVGANVTASGAGTTKTITVTGASSPLTTKGDVYTRSTVDARIGIGTDGQAFFADSTQTTGNKWADVAFTNINQTAWGIKKRWRLITGVNGDTGEFLPNSVYWTGNISSQTSQVPDWSSDWLSISKSLPQSSALVNSTIRWNTSSSDFGMSSRAWSGVYFVCRVGFHTVTATRRAFFGLATSWSNTMLNANPSAKTNIAGFGCDDGDTQFSFMHNDAAGTATKDSLNAGSGFPCGNNQTDFYEFGIYIAPAQTTTIGYWAKHILTGLSVTGSVTTDLVATNTLLVPGVAWGNGNTASLVTGAFTLVYAESDY